MSAQTFSFVDDFLIEKEKVRQFYQIKDVQSLSWTNSSHSLEQDFDIQLKLEDAEGNDSECFIVVSEKAVYETLVANMPHNLKSRSHVVQFLSGKTVNQLLQTNGTFKRAISDVCALNSPNFDKLETVATIILGVWDACPKSTVTIKELYERSALLSPNYIIGSEHMLHAHLELILSSIVGFSFNIQNSYINWVYNKTDTGVISYPIGSKAFLQWENDLAAAEPKTFEDLEPFLS